MKRKHILTMIDELGIKLTSDELLTKKELVWCILHHALHLTVQIERLQAKRTPADMPTSIPDLTPQRMFFARHDEESGLAGFYALTTSLPLAEAHKQISEFGELENHLICIGFTDATCDTYDGMGYMAVDEPSIPRVLLRPVNWRTLERPYTGE